MRHRAYAVLVAMLSENVDDSGEFMSVGPENRPCHPSSPARHIVHLGFDVIARGGGDGLVRRRPKCPTEVHAIGEHVHAEGVEQEGLQEVLDPLGLTTPPNRPERQDLKVRPRRVEFVEVTSEKLSDSQELANNSPKSVGKHGESGKGQDRTGRLDNLIHLNLVIFLIFRNILSGARETSFFV